MIKLYLLQGIIQKTQTEKVFSKNLVIPSKNMKVRSDDSKKIFFIAYLVNTAFKDLSANFTDRYHVTTTV